MERLLALGAKEYEPKTVRGEGFVTASFLDPFGNILAVMYNQHYLDTLRPAGLAEIERAQAEGRWPADS